MALRFSTSFKHLIKLGSTHVVLTHGRPVEKTAEKTVVGEEVKRTSVGE